MTGHISWLGVLDYIGMGAFVVMGLAAAVTVWWEGRQAGPGPDLVERLRGHERHR